MISFLRNLRKNAFWNGFLDGLAAPAYLFGYRSRKLGVEKFKLKPTATGSIVDDWKKIGFDLRRAIDKYGETHPI